MLSKNRVVPVITSAELERDAHAALRQYRESHPFVLLEAGGYVVLRHDDVQHLSRDLRLQATETAIPAQAGLTKGALFDIFQHGMLTVNGTDHARRRTPMSRALASVAIDHFRASVRTAAEGLVDGFRDGRTELVSGYAAKLPVLALAGMFGVPHEEVPDFIRDIDKMNEFFRPSATGEAIGDAELAATRAQDHLKTLIARKWAGQADDFLSQYLSLAEGYQQLSRIEILIQIVQMIIGGTESVQTALVAQTANLLSHPAQWKAVCSDPALVSAAVSESLRYEPGIAGLVRVSTEEIDIDGWSLPAGQLVILSSLSALRDCRVFERADSFDIFRPGLAASQLAFGGGAHRCIAEAFGRAELEEGLRVLSHRLPNLTLENRPVFTGHVFVRRTTECWVNW